MPAAWLLLAALASGLPAQAEASGTREAPSYTAASILNSADGQAALAPNTFATIYGANLAYVTKAISSDDIRGGVLPTVLIGTGVRVLVNHLPANIYYVSPTQINLLIPACLNPGPAEIQLILDANAGPAITVTLSASAPAFFQLDAQNVVATLLDGSVITKDNPARADDWVILYANGLGQTNPPAIYGQIPYGAAPLDKPSEFSLTLNGVPVDASRIGYVGAAPGYAGLFQINLKLPPNTPPDPEIQITAGGQTSPPSIHLFVK